MEILKQSLSRRIKDARCQLDAHVREIVEWHFSPETGCPFWLEFAEKLEFDPRQEIGGYDDLKILGHFEDEWLRGGPVRRWVPKAYADEPVYVLKQGALPGFRNLVSASVTFRLTTRYTAKRFPTRVFHVAAIG